MNNGIGIQVSGTRRDALAYIRVGSEWRGSVPHVYTNGKFCPTCIPEEQVEYSYAMTHSDSYRGSWGAYSDNDIRQGYYDGKRIIGCIWFDNATIREQLNKATIEQASLKLFAMSGFGRGTAVNVELCGTLSEYASHTSAAPTVDVTYGQIGRAYPNAATTMTVPNKAVEDLVKGTINALVLYSSDTTYHEDEAYSTNYACFAGETNCTDATRPVLTVEALKKLL